MNKMNNIKEIGEMCDSATKHGVFPGLGLGVATGCDAERQRLVIHRGYTRLGAGSAINEATLFDLASLTKPLATTLLILIMITEGRIRLNNTVARFFEQAPPDKAEITIRDLLGHSSGLAAHQPYYQKLMDIPPAERKERALQMILAEPLRYPKGTKAIYSDLGFVLLGLVVERIAGKGLDRVFHERVAQPLGLADNLFYNRVGAPRTGRSYAATEFCPWRGRVLCGEVSDENCFALDGVAGHAGLFGTTGAVLTLVEAIHDLWLGETCPLAISPADLRAFLTRQPTPESTWALGFDTPSASGSTSGRFFSPRSVGHLGFTGTSFWIDPEHHVMVVVLSNRVHPSRENNQIRAFRPTLHDAVMRGLGLAAS